MNAIILNGTLKPSRESSSGEAAAHNLVAVAKALQANPIGKPPNA